MLPIDDTIDLAIELVCIQEEVPLTFDAKMVRFKGRYCEVQLSTASPWLQPGAGAVITFQEGGPYQLTGVIDRIVEDRLRLHVTRITTQDKRYYPRMNGDLNLRYRVMPRGRPPTHWLSGLEKVDAEQSWFRPRSQMNFSSSGLRFNDAHECRTGDLLALELEIPGAPSAYRATGRVVRTDPSAAESPEQTEDLGSVAVEFVEISEGAVQALASFTLEQQLMEINQELDQLSQG